MHDDTLPQRYFHVDCWNKLSPGELLQLDSNGYSRFGNQYAGALAQLPRHSLQPGQRRERDLEVIRQWHFPQRRSRLHSFFAATTLEAAERHASRMKDAPSAVANVFEVFAAPNRVELDVMWLDIAGLPDEQMQQRYVNYWEGLRSSDLFAGATSRRPALLEVLLPFPVRIGQLVTATKRSGEHSSASSE